MTAALLEMQMSWGETLKTSVVGFVLVIVILAVIAVLIRLISKIFEAGEKAFGKNKAKSTANNVADKALASAQGQKPLGRPLPDSESQGELKLENVDEPTAAVIMAIVSNQSRIPLNRLLFKSIKLIEEK